jgi:uncharacterized protein (DUF488 family)
VARAQNSSRRLSLQPHVSNEIPEKRDFIASGIATIGVYGFDLASFLEALDEGEVGTVVDVRQRRGVRGPQYAWANARRLQAALSEAGFGYRHMKELAPTTELRQLQYREDARLGEGKRSRTKLAPEYARRYTEEILDHVDLSTIAELAAETRPALLCVERDPEACHRSLIAQRLRRDWDLEARHLRPS